MSQKRLSMRKLREIARLKFATGRTFEEIAAAVGIARSTVQTALGRLSAAGLSWPWPAALDEAAVESLLYPRKPGPQSATGSLPDFAAIAASYHAKG